MIRTLAIAAAAAILAAPAHANSTDDAYLAALNSHGIQGDPAALINSGHDACNAATTAPPRGPVASATRP
jgi:hypothetical protein